MNSFLKVVCKYGVSKLYLNIGFQCGIHIWGLDVVSQVVFSKCCLKKVSQRGDQMLCLKVVSHGCVSKWCLKLVSQSGVSK